MKFEKLTMDFLNQWLPKPNYWLCCQYDIVQAGYYIRFSCQRERQKVMFFYEDRELPQSSLTEADILNKAERELTYSALQSFREYYEGLGGSY